jgi:aspartate/methionine/tyrosine aminotransferase
MPALAAMKLTREGKVARRVEEDTIRAQYVADAKEYQMTAMRTAWFEANEKRQTERRHRIEQHMHKEELIQANHELVLQRRTRLKEFLTAEAVAYERQLNEIGLAFVKDRT